MGNRRIGRKRLYAVEKAGQLVNLESGAGIAGAIASASQHRNGQEIITEIAVDLNPSTITLAGGSSNENACGVSGEAAFITALTHAKYGIITEVRAVVVEACNKNWDVVLSTASSAAGVGGPASAGKLAVLEDMTTLGKDNSRDIDTGATNLFLYIAAGAAAQGGEAASGKVLIYIHGFEAPADL